MKLVLIQYLKLISKSKQFRIDPSNYYYLCLISAIRTCFLAEPGFSIAIMLNATSCPAGPWEPVFYITASPKSFSLSQSLMHLIIFYFPLLFHFHKFFRLSRLMNISFIFFTSLWFMLCSQHKNHSMSIHPHLSPNLTKSTQLHRVHF